MVGMDYELNKFCSLFLSDSYFFKKRGRAANRIILVQLSLTTLKGKTLEISIRTNTA